ncbi:hypothetical protein MNBD_GAMMA10-29 [hydrothermal vent metagenome]|uniref:Hydrolase n=1 Tax=hydrothermal vent metagenome TaxID=652676 RepID=A0A3B0XV62_9ZZZZ
MGPGILFKALLQGSFSLMVFGWAQIIMDIQPLIVLITGEGHLHGFTHTYIGSILLAIFSGFTGKYLSEYGLRLLGISEKNNRLVISWYVVYFSAFAGTLSHVFLDSIMHGDIEPFSPFYSGNGLLGILTVSALYKLCFYSGVAGAILYYLIRYREFILRRKK